MSLLIRTPDGTALDVAPSVAVDGAKEQILFVLGRGSYGVSNAELRVSRIAAEIVRHAAGPPSPSGISIRVKGRNPLYLSPATDAAAASPIDPATLRLLSPTAGPFAWPIGATLFLLHSDGAPMMHGFQLLRSEPLIEEAEDVRPSVDPEATQDVPLAAHYLSADDAAAALPAAQDQQRSPSLRLEYGHSLTFDNSSQSQRPAHTEQSKTSTVATPAARAAEMKPSRKRSHALAEAPLPAAAASSAASSSPAAAIAASSQVPLSAPIAETEVCIPETEMALHTEMEVIPEEEPAEHASAAAASSSAAAPAAAAAAAAAAPAEHMHVGLHEAGAAAASTSAAVAAAAADDSAVAAAAAAPSDDPPSKRARLLLVKRSLDAPPSAAPPSEFLKGWAVYVLAEGIGLKQQEILNTNILKRGGVILHEFPKHGMHTVHADKKHRSSSKSRSPSPAPAAAAAAAAASSDRKLHILLIVSPSIRSRKEISDVLARRLRHDKQMAEAAHAHTHHLGIPRAAGGAGAGVNASPPTSPTLSSASTPTASPARISLSGSSAASAAPPLRLRSQWRICSLAYLVDSNKRGQLLPVDQYVLDDEDPAAIAAANRKLDFKDDASTVSAASTTVPASAMSVAASSAAAAAGPGAAETEFVLGGHEDDADDDEESKYADDNDPTAQLTSPAAIAAWNAPVAAHLQTTSEAYHAQSGQHFREIAFRRAAGIVRSLTFPLQSADQVKGMHGIGSGVLEVIKSVLETGKSSRLDSLKADPVLRVYQLLQTVHGVGPKIAEKLYAQGIRTLDDMRTKVKLTAQQATYLQYYDELRSPIPRGEVAVFERRIKQALAEMDPKLRMVVCGSYRRGKDKVGDIDCLISHPDPAYRYEDEHTRRAASSVGGAKKSSFAFLLDELTRRLFAQGILTDELITPSNKFKSKVKNIYESGSEQELWGGIGKLPLDAARGWGGLHRRIDLKVYAADEFPFALLYFTGSKDFNRLMRLYANVKFSYSLSDKALSPYVRKGADKVVSGMSIPCATEEDIFAALKLDYIPPTQRDVIPAVFLRR